MNTPSLPTELTEYSLNDEVVVFCITISAESLPKNNLSPTFAPIRYPCVRTGGLICSLLNPKRYNLDVLLLDEPRSIVNQSTSSSVDSIALGGIM